MSVKRARKCNIQRSASSKLKFNSIDCGVSAGEQLEGKSQVDMQKSSEVSARHLRTEVTGRSGRGRLAKSKRRNECQKIQISFKLFLSLLALQISTFLISQASGSSNFDQVARLFKPMQESVAEGHATKLECKEDYVIDVIAAVHTISARPGAADESPAPAGARAPASQPIILGPQLPANGSGGGADNNSSTADRTREELASGSGGQCANWSSLSAEEATALVKSNCHGLSACKLDLRWQSSPSANATSSLQRQALSEQAKKLRKTLLGINGTNSEEGCPGRSRRSLLEVVYRCRANKMKARTVCRHSRLHLECQPERLIVIVSGDYGGWPNETRMNHNCSAAAARPLAAPSPSPPPPANLTNCLANQTATSLTLVGHCMHRRQCALDVQPEVLGQTNCPSSQPEFLKVFYICAIESYLNSVAGAASVQREWEQQQQPAEPPPREPKKPTEGPRRLLSAASSARPSEQLCLLPDDWPLAAPINAHYPALRLHVQRHWRLMAGCTALTFVIFVLVKISKLFLDSRRKPTSKGINNDDKCPSSKLLRESRNSTSSSSKNSSYSTASGGTGSESFLIKYLQTNSTSSSQCSAGGALSANQQTGSANREALMMMMSQTNKPNGSISHNKHNSCSESCFSLDDYNLTQPIGGGPGSSATDSPGLMINEESPTGNELDQQQQQPSSQTALRQAFATARPRLWSIYGSEQRHHHHLSHQQSHQQQQHFNHPTQNNHFPASFCNQTMRPTRTFVGRTRCAQHQPPPPQAPGALLGGASELLLAMAKHNQSLKHMSVTAGQASTQNGPAWCQTSAGQPSPVDRMSALLQQQQLSLHNHHDGQHRNEFEPDEEQMLEGSAENQCHFHQQREQQQQHQIVFPPPALQLELPQLIASSQANQLVAAAGQLSQHSQQPAPPLGMRQYQQNFPNDQPTINQLQQQ